MPTRSGRALAIVRIVEALGGAADPVVSDPPAPLYDYLPGVERVRTDPAPDVDYDLAVISDCGSLDRIGELGVRYAELFERLPRVVLDHHASNEARGDADWIDPAAAATCEMVTLLAIRLGVPLDIADGAMAAALMGGIVMDTATFAHPNATPRTLAVSAALVEAGAPLSDISRRLYRIQAGRPAAPVRSRARPPGDRRRRPHHLVDADRCRPRRHGDRAVGARRGSSTSLHSPRPPRWPSCSRRTHVGRGSASGRDPVASMRPS